MILLVDPPAFTLTNHPPLGLGYLAAVLARRHRETRIVDLRFDDHRQSFDRLLAGARIDWIGLSVSLQNLTQARPLIDTIKLCAPRVPVVIGGTYPSTLPDICLDELNADVAVIGEAEGTVTELDAALRDRAALEGLPGLVLRQGEQTVKTGPRRPFARLDDLPMPDYRQIPPARYSRIPWQIAKRGRIVGPILTSRGCPYDCSFCATSLLMGRKVRVRSIPLVGEELEYLHRRFGVDEFHVSDPNLVVTREHAAGFCEEILRRGLKVHWKTPNGVRPDFLDHELLSLMKRSGCYMLGFGIESGNPAVLRQNKKAMDLALVRDRIRSAGEHGITTFGYFILDLPGDSRDTIEQTIQFAVDLDLDLAHFSFCVPYPGTRLYDRLDRAEQAQVRQRAWHFVPWPQNRLSEGELRELHRKAHARFYLRPRTIRLLLELFNRQTALPFLRALSYYMTRRSVNPTGRRATASDDSPLARGPLARMVTPTRLLVEGGFGRDLAVVRRFVERCAGRVLDVGCGEGQLAGAIPPERYLGIDVSAAWIARAQRRHPDRAFVCGDFGSMRNLSPGFGLVLLSKLLHHQDDAQARAMLERAMGLLQDDGLVLVLEPEHPRTNVSWFHQAICALETGEHHRSARALENLLPDHGSISETGQYKIRPMEFYYAAIERRPRETAADTLQGAAACR